MSDKTKLSITELRSALNTFWDEALEIESISNGFVFAMPLSYPDGWQVVLHLEQKSPKAFLLSDRGKTITWLQGQGQSIHTDGFRSHFLRLCAEHHIEEDQGILSRLIDHPVDPVDIQVFAEGIVAISRLDILHEHRIVLEDVADQTVNRIFRDAGLEPQRHHSLQITPQRSVSVDFFVSLRRPLAVQMLRTRTDISGTMEKWGYRWRELKKTYQGLAPVMLYDRDTQFIDPYSAHIGETDCELFCSYDETEKVHHVLESIR